MKKAFLFVILIFLNASAHSKENNCMDRAQELLIPIVNNKNFEPEDYKIKQETGVFASEKTEIYYFYRHILDSWKVELAAHDCFPIGIWFIGDL